MSEITGMRGETPRCSEARFKRGDIVLRRKLHFLQSMREEFIVLVAIPPGFSPDYALADLFDKSRPLMHRVGSKAISYLLHAEGGDRAYLLKEAHLLPSGKEPVEIGSISAAPAHERGGG